MSYDNSHRQKYAFYFDAGNNGNETWTVKGPKGKSGTLIDYGVEGVVEAFTADASLAIGTAADPDAYGEELAFGVIALEGVKSLRSLYDEIADAAAFNALLVDRTIPADTSVQMTLVDDAAAGMGTFFCIIEWDD